MDQAINDAIRQLRDYLNEQAEGPVGDDGRRLLMNSWSALDGSDATSMSAEKLRAERVENLRWAPPILLFEIERHGQTVCGSSRATLYTWQVNPAEKTARIVGEKPRQIHAMDARLDVKPVAESLAHAIISGARDERLKWAKDGTVRINMALAIPVTNKQTTASRRKRLREAVINFLLPSGWVEKRPSVYEKCGAA